MPISTPIRAERLTETTLVGCKRGRNSTDTLYRQQSNSRLSPQPRAVAPALDYVNNASLRRFSEWKRVASPGRYGQGHPGRAKREAGVCGKGALSQRQAFLGVYA